jgi:hypothetical protein
MWNKDLGLINLVKDINPLEEFKYNKELLCSRKQTETFLGQWNLKKDTPHCY